MERSLATFARARAHSGDSNGFDGTELRKIARLTKRECEILDLVASGLTNGSIALKLGVSTHTVRSHLRNAYTKLDVAGRVEAIVLLSSD